jgi:hypothetical protein
MTAAAFVVAACGDGNGPGGGGDFDPVTSKQEAEEILTSVGENPAVQSLALIQTQDLNFAAVGIFQATAPVAMPTLASRENWATSRTALLRRIAPRFSSTGTAIVIPTEARGTTFEFNTSTGNYEAGSQTGAPSNGVRFILYEPNSSGTAPATPLNDIGHLDLVDESTGSTDAIGIVAVIGNVTMLDYSASASATSTAITFGASGFISDGTTQVNFNLENDFSDSQIHILYSLDVEGQDTGVSIELTSNASGATIEVVIEVAGDNLTFHAEGGETSFSGTVTFNGDVVAEFSGDENGAEFTDADGNPLTAEDVEALNSMFELEELFGVFEALLGPALFLLGASF